MADFLRLISEKIPPNYLTQRPYTCYNFDCWLLDFGEMAERLMALVLKTSDAFGHRGFESLSLRHFYKYALCII